jgi:hypothetical protein
MAERPVVVVVAEA